MSSVLSYLQLERSAEAAPIVNEALRRQVWGILAGLYPPGKTSERRIDQRFPYPHLLYLSPVGDGTPPSGSSVTAIATGCGRSIPVSSRNGSISTTTGAAPK